MKDCVACAGAERNCNCTFTNNAVGQTRRRACAAARPVRSSSCRSRSAEGLLRDRDGMLERRNGAESTRMRFDFESDREAEPPKH
jgi:hypothetical protein